MTLFVLSFARIHTLLDHFHSTDCTFVFAPYFSLQSFKTPIRDAQSKRIFKMADSTVEREGKNIHTKQSLKEKNQRNREPSVGILSCERIERVCCGL